MYAQRVITPLLPDLATRVVGAYGAVINIDFSSSDSKQLLPKRRQRVPTAKTSQAAAQSAPRQLPVRHLKGRLWSGCSSVLAAPSHGRKRTWGAATGLDDMPLLPSLFARAEDASTKL